MSGTVHSWGGWNKSHPTPSTLFPCNPGCDERAVTVVGSVEHVGVGGRPGVWSAHGNTQPTRAEAAGCWHPSWEASWLPTALTRRGRDAGAPRQGLEGGPRWHWGLVPRRQSVARALQVAVEAAAWRGLCGCSASSAVSAPGGQPPWGEPSCPAGLEVLVGLGTAPSPAANLVPSWPVEDITSLGGGVWPPQRQTDTD